MRKGRSRRRKKKGGGGNGRKKKRLMIIVATTLFPAIDQPDADRWNAAGLFQLEPQLQQILVSAIHYFFFRWLSPFTVLIPSPCILLHADQITHLLVLASAAHASPVRNVTLPGVYRVWGCLQYNILCFGFTYSSYRGSGGVHGAPSCPTRHNPLQRQFPKLPIPPSSVLSPNLLT